MTPGKVTNVQNPNENKKRQESPVKRSRDLGQRPTTSARQIGLRRSDKVLFEDRESLDSGDNGVVCPSTAPEARRSVDVVVVDVHNESKGSERSSGARKLFKQRTTAQDTNPESPSLTRKQRRKEFEQGNAWEIRESIDAIKEFEDTSRVFAFASEPEPVIEEIENAENSDDSNSAESVPQLFGSSEKIVGTSKGNSALDGEAGEGRFKEEPKRRRKRWSKNKNNLHLTQELIANSSDTNQSAESDSRFSDKLRDRPVPAPRRKGAAKFFAHETILAFDNAAFKSDPEEILRIETAVYEPQGTPDGSKNYRQSTKIEMTNFYDSYEKVVEKDSVAFDSENEFTGSVYVRDNKKLDRIESLKALEFVDTSDEAETEVRKVKKSEDSQVSSTPSKTRRKSSAGEVLETSELSEDGKESHDQVFRSDRGEKRKGREKVKRKDRLSSKRESNSLDTGNSLTDISDLPRSKTRREVSRKSETRRQRDSKNEGSGLKQRSKRCAENESENDLIECNADREEKFTSVTIHKTDVLETDFLTRHPMVKVHIVDVKTGNYLKIENDDNYKRCSYLQPMITGKFDFKDNRSIVPNWEEELIFEYNFEEVIQPVDKSILILFEILDLLNFAEASFNYNVLGNEGCWHKIAWAFLRPVGVNGTSHINKKIRLQLYEPSKASKKSGRLAKCEVFNWWRSPTKEKYPSTLYVTLKSVDPPIQEPIVYERLSINELPDIEDESRGSCKKSSDLLQLPKWTRLAAQSCKIPNNHLFETQTFENGSFHLTFSNNGKYLACVGSEDSNYPIVVYAIPEGNICARFIGHANFIYSLNWSNDDKYLLSVSSDQTACIWDMGNKIIQHIQMLPHPSYVYCGKFYPQTKNVVITGCHDRVARVWTKSKSSKRYELTQELYEHKGYVNSLSFQKDGGLITADSVGAIILWTVKKIGGVSWGREWRALKTIKNNELENVVVNTIILHPFGSRLLVHSRDNGLKMIDLETGVVLQRYKGLRNRRLQIAACLSPCGGLVLCGGEDSCLNVWSLESGTRLAKYIIRGAKLVASVAYHPFDHILAFSTFGSISAVQIMNFDNNSTGEKVGLNLLVDNKAVEDSDDIEITVKFDKNDLPTNLKANYSGRITANVSKREGTIDSGINRSWRNGRQPSSEIGNDITNENTLSRRDLLRLKIQRLNESEEGLKSRSAARLNNIIEKIDRILVNTTSKRELDSTFSSNDTRGPDPVQVSSNSKSYGLGKSEEKVRSRSWKSRSREKGSTLNPDATMELCNAGTELIEMHNICSSVHNETSENEELTNSKKRVSRGKSRTGTTANISSHSDVESEEKHSEYNSSGDSHFKVYSKENTFGEESDVELELNSERRRRGRKGNRKGRRLSSFSDENPIPETKTCIINLGDLKTGLHSNPSTSDSAGTYTIDKKKFSKDWASDKSKATDTSSSVKSSATFTIENEISSSPKSAKK